VAGAAPGETVMAAEELLGGPVQSRPRKPAVPVAALLAKVEVSARRATAIAEALAGEDEQAAAIMRDVAVSLAGQAATLRDVLASLAPGVGEPGPG
jgi:hypothetical protein